MGEIVDLDSYRRQRKRRPAEVKHPAARRGRKPTKDEHARPAIEPLDSRRGGADPAKVDPHGKGGE